MMVQKLLNFDREDFDYFVYYNSTNMKKTVRDLEKAGASSIKWLKAGLYYLYLPAVVLIGLRTVDWGMFSKGP